MSAGTHTRMVGNERHVWRVEDLWRLSASLPVEVGDPTTLIELDRDGWFTRTTPTPRLILQHMSRILSADLSRPVILDADGSVMDGAHRICKAILLGEQTIRFVRFTETPPPSSIRSRDDL